MKKLVDVFNDHNDRIIHKWFHYLEVYERFFQRFIDTPVKILEIGVEEGGSLQLWKEYFGDKCEIVGIDINPKTKFEEPQIKVEIGSQTDANFLSEIENKYGPFDIIIDDGSHLQMDVLNSFSFLYPKLKKGGVYIIEDMHTAYFHGYGGGITSPYNFITIASRFIHDTNISFMREPYTPTLEDLKSISFHNSMVILEKNNDEEIYTTYRGKDIDKNNVKYTPENIKYFLR